MIWRRRHAVKARVFFSFFFLFSGFPNNTMTSERSDEGSFIQEYLDWIY